MPRPAAYDTSTQVKMFRWGKRYQIVPFGFGPGGHEIVAFRESGGGALAEFDYAGNQRMVAGVNFRMQQNTITHAWSPSAGIQLAMKTVY